jgi:hypothetical protein
VSSPYEDDEAQEALRTAVGSFGPQVLDNPRLLVGIVSDQLPDLTRERDLLVTAAEAGVATELRQHVEQEGMGADTAVMMAAQSLAERRSIEPGASTWVAAEYARALGYDVPGPAHLPRTRSPGQLARQQPLQSIPPQYRSAEYRQAAARPSTVGISEARSSPEQEARSSPGQAAPGDGQALPGSKPARPGRGLLIGSAVLGAAAIYLVTATIVHAPPFSGGASILGAASGTPSAASGSTAPAPGRASAPAGRHLATGVPSIAQYLPADVNAVSQCQPTQGIQWKNPGLVESFDCSDPDLAAPGGGTDGFVEAFQMDSYQHFSSAWRNFNGWFGFTRSQGSCPLASPNGSGLTGWTARSHPPRSDQVLECADSGTSYNIAGDQEIYAWTYPAEDAFMIAVAPSNWSGSQLGAWWKQNSQ